MQNILGVWLILLVAGAIIGASAVTYVIMNQNLSIEEQVKVAIQGIDYKVLDSVLEIELLNDAPEKNLEGKVVISQDEKQWTGAVTWYYTGYGEVEIICDSIDETQNFSVTYNENYPKATYLDRIIEWNEITINTQGASGSQAGAVLSVENVRFFIQEETKRIEIILRNPGTADTKVESIYVGTTPSSLTYQNAVSYYPSTQMVNMGSTLNVTLTYSWTSGTRYYFNIGTEEGLSLPFNRECSGLTIGFMETKELAVTQMTFNTGANTTTLAVSNSGTSDVTVSIVKINGNTVSDTDIPVTYLAGASAADLTLDYATYGIFAGNDYAVSLFATDGTLVGSYTGTA